MDPIRDIEGHGKPTALSVSLSFGRPDSRTVGAEPTAAGRRQPFYLRPGPAGNRKTIGRFAT